MEPYDEYMLAHKREILITGEINDETASDVFKRLRFIDALEMPTKSKRKKKPDDITIWINSHGGDVAAANMIWDSFKLLRSDICIIALGAVASAAMDIFIAGTKGKRFCTPYTVFMIHNVQSGAQGGYDEIKERIKMVETRQKQNLEHLVEHSHLTLRQLKKIIKDSDHWFDSEKAIEYGFADAVIEEPV